MLKCVTKYDFVFPALTISETLRSNSKVIREYLQDHFCEFIPQKVPEQHLLLVLDGHKSHISIDLLEWTKEKKIILFILSNILQPFDVSF